ncbi:MAG TPA: PEP-CTERM sorting domain-containing protein [Roseiarcus sp.]|nr:PEP-CTERM sorting domain-containing protein [Roseiarcus sp.]
MKRGILLASLAFSVASALTPISAFAANNLFQEYIGDYGVSTSGWGSVSTSDGTVAATVPVGSTVTAAYLYTSTWDFSAPFDPSGTTFQGSPISLTPLGVNSSACCNLQGWRADVTSLVAPVINGGPGGTYDFSLTEANTTQQDGEALVVVYSNPSQSTQTVAILNGFASSSGDTSVVNFSKPLDTSAPGFFAHMAIGDGFSCCDQESTISVNGKEMTTVAGNNDSSVDASPADGNLITMGNINGPYTGGTPGFPQTDYSADHEAYDLVPFLSDGETTIKIDTINASHDDNIFVEVYDVSGEGHFVPGTPEPSTWVMLVIGFAGLGYAARRKGLALRSVQA